MDGCAVTDSNNHREPGYALKRELDEEQRDRKDGDVELGKRISRTARRVRNIGRIARGAALSVKISAVAHIIQTVILVLMLTRQWPELWPAILKTVGKLVGL